MKIITQTIIAKKANISNGFLSQLINGIRRPSWRTAKKLAKITKTKPELWLEGEPEKIQKAVERLAA